MSFWQKLKDKLIKKQKNKNLLVFEKGLSKSNKSFSKIIQELRTKNFQLNNEYFEKLEEILIMADISYKYVEQIIDEIKKEVKLEGTNDPNIIEEIILDKIFNVYTNSQILDTTLNISLEQKNVILVTGVNGSGKTTSIAKLANILNKQGYKVLVAAADTFRAAATEQLEIWSQKVNFDIVKGEDKQDPSSVVYTSLQKLKSENYNVLIIDTAGRLQNKVNLMNELKKINNTIYKMMNREPHESLLVIDATIGQNGINQAVSFKETTPISGIILTKMDGTSKGGIILTIKEILDIPVKFIGLGEKIDDFQEFDIDAFTHGITKGLKSV